MCLNMTCSFSNTPYFCQINGSFVINFNYHWKLWFKSNVVENYVHKTLILSTLCCWEKFCPTYRQLHNPLHYTFHCRNYIKQYFDVSTYTFTSVRTLRRFRIIFSTDHKFKTTITIPFGTRPQCQPTFICYGTVFHCEKHGSHMSISSFSNEPW